MQDAAYTFLLFPVKAYQNSKAKLPQPLLECLSTDTLDTLAKWNKLLASTARRCCGVKSTTKQHRQALQQAVVGNKHPDRAAYLTQWQRYFDDQLYLKKYDWQLQTAEMLIHKRYWQAASNKQYQWYLEGLAFCHFTSEALIAYDKILQSWWQYLAYAEAETKLTKVKHKLPRYIYDAWLSYLVKLRDQLTKRQRQIKTSMLQRLHNALATGNLNHDDLINGYTKQLKINHNCAFVYGDLTPRVFSYFENRIADLDVTAEKDLLSQRNLLPWWNTSLNPAASSGLKSGVDSVYIPDSCVRFVPTWWPAKNSWSYWLYKKLLPSYYYCYKLFQTADAKYLAIWHTHFSQRKLLTVSSYAQLSLQVTQLVILLQTIERESRRLNLADFSRFWQPNAYQLQQAYQQYLKMLSQCLISKVCDLLSDFILSNNNGVLKKSTAPAIVVNQAGQQLSSLCIMVAQHCNACEQPALVLRFTNLRKQAECSVITKLVTNRTEWLVVFYGHLDVDLSEMDIDKLRTHLAKIQQLMVNSRQFNNITKEKNITELVKPQLYNYMLKCLQQILKKRESSDIKKIILMFTDVWSQWPDNWLQQNLAQLSQLTNANAMHAANVHVKVLINTLVQLSNSKQTVSPMLIAMKNLKQSAVGEVSTDMEQTSAASISTLRSVK